MTTNNQTIEELAAQAEFAQIYGTTIDEISETVGILNIINNYYLRQKFSGPRPAIMIHAVMFLAILKKYYNVKDGPLEDHAKSYIEMILKTINPEALDDLGKHI